MRSYRNVIPSIVPSSETGFLRNRAGREAVRGEVWQARSGELQRPLVQPAELCGRERGGTDHKRKAELFLDTIGPE